MKLFNYILLILSAMLISCADDNNPELKEKTNTNVNILITPDLSNRIDNVLYPKPISDEVLISSILDNYYPKIYKSNNRVMGQKDKVNISFTNPRVIDALSVQNENLGFDLSSKNNAERIEYLTQNEHYNFIQNNFKPELNKLYKNARSNTTGGDIYNYFKELNNISLMKNEEPKVIDGTIVKTNNRNIIILLTDGYLEAGLYGDSNCNGNKCYYLDQNVIRRFRKDYKASGEIDMDAFFKKSGYGIIPVKNPNLKNVEIVVAELYDRSLNRTTGSQTVVPNDLEIIKLFWKDWLQKSGFKRIHLMKTSNTKEEFVNTVIEFIEN